MSPFTDAQQQAIAADGNVLVVAGAGTGKTSTVVGRCLRLLLHERCSLQQMLLVTFTEAAAAEMRQRIREALLQRLKEQPLDEHLAEQVALLDTAHISTLHAFCRQLVSDHACELGIDPQVAVLDEAQTQPLIEETLDAVFARHYRPGAPLGLALEDLVRKLGRGSDERIRSFIVRIHRYTQTRPDPERWFESEIARFSQTNPVAWRDWLLEGFRDWCASWLPVLRSQPAANIVAHRCVPVLERDTPALSQVAEAVTDLSELDTDRSWPRGTRGKFRDPIKKLFDDLEFFRSLTNPPGEADPLQQDWDWVRQHMLALLRLAREFTEGFSRAKRDLGGVDFSDLEQLALRLLCDETTGGATAIARAWQERFRYVFVDEYQDINKAQDTLMRALSREGNEANRFLVGDVKQSIYRFRLANPRIFQDYEDAWRRDPTAGTCIPLAENFRSREALVQCVNSFFGALMRPALGGLAYDANAMLRFGDREKRKALSVEPEEYSRAGNQSCSPVEFHLLAKADEEAESGGGDETDATPFDLTTTEKEARLVALRLRELKEQGHLVWDSQAGAFRPVAWRDMVVLLRSPAGKVEAYAKKFHRAGVPLQAARGGFFDSLEVMDLLNLLKLLDNPLQDVSLLAVLRSPLVGMSLDELVAIRAAQPERLFWTALCRFREVQRSMFEAHGSKLETASRVGSAGRKADLFLRRFESWRTAVRLTSLSHCLESVLEETHYEAVLRAGERGAERAGNVRKLLDLARQYDPFQRQGLFRFLRHVALQQDAGLDLEPAPLPAEDAVSLMSIHQSKGREFPVVVVADLGKRFNLAGLRDDLVLSEDYGLCPHVTPPGSDQRYPSLPLWLARRRELRELLGEELRLLYVAMTRARDTLILCGFASDKAAAEGWDSTGPAPISDQDVLSARCLLDWLRLWLPHVATGERWQNDHSGESKWLRWHIWLETDPSLAVEVPDEPVRPPVLASDLSADAAREIAARVTWTYPFDATTRERAKTSVSELKRREVEADEDALSLFPFRLPASEWRPLRRERGSAIRLSAAERGTAHHRFMQFISLAQADNAAALQREAARMEQAGILSEPEVAALDFEALVGFWKSALGQRIRAQAGSVRREMQFTARFSARDLTALGLPMNATLPEDEFIVVQGVIDLAVVRPDGIWLVDFKTDNITGANLAERVRTYAPQLNLYALALQCIYGRPIHERWLHFFKAGQSVLT